MIRGFFGVQETGNIFVGSDADFIEEEVRDDRQEERDEKNRNNPVDRPSNGF